jgi:hypothetical protein
VISAVRIWRRRSALLLLMFAAGCARLPPSPQPAPAPAVATIYVIDRGWHTELGLAEPIQDKTLAAVARRFQGARYLVIGFGDSTYLKSRTRGFGTMIGALFPGRGILLVTALRAPPAEAFGASQVVPLGVSQDGLEEVLDFLSASFAVPRNGVPREEGAGPYPGSLFYASTRTYDLAYTCNTWMAQALHRAGLPVSAGGVIFAGQLMRQARAAERAEPMEARAGAPAP